MKRKLFIILSLAMLVGEVFALDTVATTYQTNLKPQDMVEIFVEELNRNSYRYQIADYKVYTEPENQNIPWTVAIGNEGYDCNNGRTHVREKSIYLFMKNGYVCFKTFGGSTTSNMKDCIDANNEDFSKIRDSVYDSIDSYIRESKTWLKRYNKSYNEDELEALDMLNNVTWLNAGMYYIQTLDYVFKRDYSVTKDNSIFFINDIIKNNSLDWDETFDFEEMLDFCKRHNCYLYKRCENDSLDPKSVKKSELKKAKKENKDIYVYASLVFTIWKVQDDKLVTTKIYQQHYINIDDMLQGNYENIHCRCVDKLGNVVEVEY